MEPLVVWFLYANLAALGISAAGWLGERVLLWNRGPARLAWTLSIALSVAVPAAGLLWGEQLLTVAGLSGLDSTVTRGLLLLSGNEVAYTAGGEYELTGRYALWIAGGWTVASGLVIGWLVLSADRLRRARADWIERRGPDESYFLTPSLGPGVTGVLRQRILIPQWVLGLEPEERELIRAHETEHVSSGDNRLLAGGLAVLILFPWILPLWWQFYRLQTAVEIDCDRRVLAEVPDRRRYGELLIRVRSGSTLLPVAPFSRRDFHLERRIRSLFLGEVRGRGIRTAAASVLAATLLCVTLALPVPAAENNWSLLPLPPEAVKETLEPPLTPYDEHEVLLNGAEISRAVDRWYPDELRERGIEGEVGLMIHVTEEGSVDRVRLHDPSPRDAFNRAAKRVALLRRYRPARDDGAPTDVWLFTRVRFELPSPSAP